MQHILKLGQWMMDSERWQMGVAKWLIICVTQLQYKIDSLLQILWLGSHKVINCLPWYSPLSIDSTTKAFICTQTIGNRSSVPEENSSKEPIMITILFKNRRLADNTRSQLQSLSCKIGMCIQPVFTSWKIGDFQKPGNRNQKHWTMRCVPL